MKIKIVNSRKLGLPDRTREGKAYECVKIGIGYQIVERGVPAYKIKDDWVSRGWAELVQEFNFMFGMGGVYAVGND